MKRFSPWLLALIWTVVSFTQATGGTWTPGEFLYKPSLGARGETEKNLFDAGLDRIDARLGKEVWVGDPKYGTTLQSAIYAIGSNLATLRVPPGTWGITANLVVPANIHLKAEKGAILSISTTKTLTINGGLDAGPYQIFSCTGTGKVVLPISVTTNILWFGTDAAAFASAVAATQDGGTMFMPAGNYTYTSGVTVNKDINFIMETGAYIIFNHPGVALNFSEYIGRRTIQVNVTRDLDWTTGNVGVQFAYMQSCDLYVNAFGFEKGLYLYNNIDGNIAYNNIYVGNIWFCKYGIRAKAAAPGMYVSANKFFGGRVACGATTGDVNSDRFGIYLEKASSNLFYGMTVEYYGGIAGTGKAYPFTVVDGNGNKFYGDPEGGDYSLVVEGESSDNTIIGKPGAFSLGTTFQSTIVDNSTTFPGSNRVLSDHLNYPLQSVFDIDVVNKAVVETTSGGGIYYEYNINGCIWLRNNGNFYLTWSVDGAYEYLNETEFRIPGSAALGRRVNTTLAKDFRLSYTGTGADTLAIVKAYGADGNVLSSGVTGYSEKIAGTSAFAYVTDYGGAFTCQLIEPVFFHLGPDVKSIWVGICATDTIQGFSLKSFYNYGIVPSDPGYDLLAEGAYSNVNATELSSSVKPKGGVFGNGTRIWDLNTAAGGVLGWVVTGRQTTQANGGEPAGETDVLVDSITGVADGDVIGVIITDGTINKWHWTTVHGAPSASTIVLNHAVPTGFTIADDAKVITYRLKDMAAIAS